MDHYLPPSPLTDLLEQTFGKKITRWIIPDCGLTAALRYSVFLKTEIAGYPGSFLKPGICSETWFTRAISTLIEAGNSVDLCGESLVGGDMRSENRCVLDGQVIFADWSHAAIGNKNNDVATLLPALYLEGGPVPYRVMPGGGGFAALQAGWHI